MLNKRFCEFGRVVLGKYGEVFDKLAVIVDIIDMNRVIIDGPTTGVARQVIPLKRLQLTDIKVKVSRAIGTSGLKKILEKEDIVSQFQATSWGKKRVAYAAKLARTDFERYCRMREKIQSRKRSQVAKA